MSLLKFNSKKEKITAIDGKQYTKEELLRTNFIVVGGEARGGRIKMINGINVENMSLKQFLNVSKNPSKTK